MLRPTTNVALRPNDYQDLLDLPPANDRDIPAANDVDARRPALRSVAGCTLAAALDGVSEDNLFADLSYDVVMGGVFVATYDPPPVGARVDVTLTVGERAFALGGVVRWIRDAELATDGLPAGCGIEWKGLPVEAARTLSEYATAREPILYLPEAA